MPPISPQWSGLLAKPPEKGYDQGVVCHQEKRYLDLSTHDKDRKNLLELTLSRLTHDQLYSARDESDDPPSFARRWPLGPLFLRAQEIEQRVRRYRTNERLTADVREQALQQAREAAAADFAG